MMKTSRSRRAFTLIELLVVIAIIAVLIAPAAAGGAGGPRGGAGGSSASTTSSRSAWRCTITSRRSACCRRGGSTATSTGQGELLGGLFPAPPAAGSRSRSSTRSTSTSPPTPTTTAVAELDRVHRRSSIPLICPSDSTPTADHGQRRADSPRTTTTSTSGRATRSCRIRRAVAGGSRLAPPTGRSSRTAKVGPADFTDGMSNTAMASETVRSTAGSTYAATTRWASSWSPATTAPTGPPLNSDADYASLCLSLPSTTTQFQATRGVRWHYGRRGTACTTTSGRPTTSSPTAEAACRTAPGPDPALELALAECRGAEQAPRRGQSLFADGHVQFIKDSINVLVWQGLGSRNGGEVIAADSF